MRTCGDCIACCVYLRIDELNKAGMTHCPHLRLPGVVEKNRVWYSNNKSTKNCMVYGTSKRPECCEGYKCAWLKGAGDKEDRPDKSLMLFDGIHQIKHAVEGKPLADGQQDTDIGKLAIYRMGKSLRIPVVVLNFYERRIVRIEGRGVE